MKYAIWLDTVAHSEAWQAEQQAIRDAANAKRSEATKAQPRSEDGSKLASGSCTASTSTRSSKTETERAPSRAAAAKSAGVDAGTVAKMDALKSAGT